MREKRREWRTRKGGGGGRVVADSSVFDYVRFFVLHSGLHTRLFSSGGGMVQRLCNGESTCRQGGFGLRVVGILYLPSRRCVCVYLALL